MFYKWDALGRRVYRDDGTTATVFVQSEQQTIADYTAGTAASSPTYTYVYASYIDEPVMRGGTGGLRYYHRNQQYSIIALTTGSGAVSERYAYSAYGTPTITDASGTVTTTSAIGNRFTYTGQENDKTPALYHYRARMYDSVSGRFCSRDPIGFWDGASLYRAYFVMNGVDPTGYTCLVYYNCILTSGEKTSWNTSKCEYRPRRSAIKSSPSSMASIRTFGSRSRLQIEQLVDGRCPVKRNRDVR